MEIHKILTELDALFEENRGKEAEALMLRSIEQAEQEKDDESLLQLQNELLGYYRETSQKEAAMEMAAQAVAQARRMGLEGTIPYATTLLNVANACRACGRLQESMEYYCQVQKVYDEKLESDDMFIAGLKNNMSLLHQEMGDYAGAKQRLLEALAIVEKKEAAYELGVTYANLAGTCMQLGEGEEAREYAAKSMKTFQREGIEDSHFAAALATMGAYYFHEKDFEEALRYYHLALETVEKYLGRNEYYRRLQENISACENAMLSAGRETGPQSGGGFARSCQAKPGLVLSREYYEAYGAEMIREKFPAYEGRIAVGLAGRGSDCFGYDDVFSRDHDWGPDFCMWVTDETYSEIGEALQQAYEQLPEEFQGCRRAPHVNGRNRRGVIRISDFMKSVVGTDVYEEIDWQNVNDFALAAAVNGEVFRDQEGIFTAFREKLKRGYPENVLYLKLAESAARFAQTAQYNYPRMLQRGDRLTAHMMAWDGMKEAMKLQHYLEGKYPPHDKWLWRSLQESEEGSGVAMMLAGIAGCLAQNARNTTLTDSDASWLCSGVDQRGKTSADWDDTADMDGEEAAGEALDGREGTGREKGRARNLAGGDAAVRQIDQLGAYFARKMYARGLISDTESFLEAHTEELVYKASLAANDVNGLAEEIARLEFEAFDKVKNEGGRAGCQDDWGTFSIMRKSQYLTWGRDMLMQYLYDFHREYRRGHNLIEEKYGRMMESTAPEKYEQIKGNFPELSQEKKDIIEQIVGLQVGWMEEFSRNYPALSQNARSIHTSQDTPSETSYETYLRGELGTYSDKMLELYGRYVVDRAKTGRNLAYEIMENSVKLYGYSSVEDAEAKVAAQA